VICVVALTSVAAQGARFRAHVPTILAPDNWLYLLLAWILLKAVHEFYHGLVCKKYGGYVPRCGIVLILFSPVAFVDVTSSWKFRSKWQRIYTAAAGMYVELFLASVAALLWCRTESGVVSQFAHNLVTTAGLSTLIFNGNFLMRFDGYYILSDLLGFQNLYGVGQQYLRYFWRRYLFGVSAQPLEQSGARFLFVRVYAWATLAWRCLFYVGLLLVAAAMFRGAGIILAVIAAVGWFVQPSLQFVRYVFFGRAHEQPRRARIALASAAAGLLLVALLIVPWPGGASAWGVVDYEPLSIVRVRSPGFVRQVHVHPGQFVEPGELLVTIENPQTRLELAQIDLLIEQSSVRARMLHSDQNVVQYQIEQENRLSLEQQREELLGRTQALEIRAASRGHVIGRNLEALEGQYLPMGAEVLSVGDERRKQIRLSVAQKDIDFFLQQIGLHPHLRVKGHPGTVSDAQLVKVNPRATCSLPHAALAAQNGGPLTVRPVAEGSTSRAWELAEPRFLAMVALPSSEAVRLRAGELARVRIEAPGQSIARRLFSWAQSWMQRKLHRRGLDA
jgi:putative peptide zinc metalloprotease protein